MNDLSQPSPDALLHAIKQQEKKKDRGVLKIFLGMAAGVGKTYAMLESARILHKQSVNLVVGVVNTHGRKETAALTEGLKIIPLKKIGYKDIVFEEFDLDKVLKLKPSLVLVDELAHTNVPGSRHPKRWQDVIEILENGIDVHTTLNVQHIESLKDVMENITGIKIRESVPDSIIEKANQIEVVDLAPSELLQRLQEGKVYLGEKSEVAAKNFFQEDRLTALREIVLRYAAEKVDHDLQGFMTTFERTSTWKPRERLLVAVSSNPYSEKLIRTARRIASNLNAPWIAVHVDDGRALNEEENNVISKYLALARDLGAEVIAISDPSVAEGIKRIVRQRGITQIILGRPPKRPFFGIFRRASVLDKLARDCADIDIHVIRQEAQIRKYGRRLIGFSFRQQFNTYIFAFIAVLLLTGINWILLPIMGYKVVGVVFLIGLLMLSLFFHKGPIFAASILFAAIWGFFFVPPEGEFEVHSKEDIALVVLYLFTAIATGILVDRARENQRMLALRESSALALYNIVRQIALAPSTTEAFKSVKEGLDKLYNGSFEIIVKKLDNGLNFNKHPTLLTDAKEKNAAIWVFENNKEAGWSTDTLPSSQNLYLPIKSFDECLGVLVYRPKVNKSLTPEEKNLIYTICQQLGNYIDRSFSDEKTRQNEQIQQIDAMRTSILNRISLVFHQPLLISQNALKTLNEELAAFKNKTIATEITKIEHSLEQLIEILANITAMAQLSEGLVPLNRKESSVKELIQVCCTNLKKETANHQLSVHIQDHLPLIAFDFHLIEMLLLNLITNAVYYSPLHSKIEVEAKRIDGFIVISVSDEGKGIPNDQLEAIFEKFYQLSGDMTRGIGLGLSIAKTIAEIHHGYLRAENRPEKGTKFSLFLPRE